ncbi:MAG: SBBP repeat-containing protein [Candidatus Thorarchaeota archaeon]|nr:SBBP repeat-containing protein [Candidatus Thorarchaeota archaeon]
MDIDSNNRIAITGTTESSDFPLLNSNQSTNAGSLDVFLSFFEADAQSILFSTYLGTTGIDHGRAIDFDSQGDILLAGMIANGDLATDGAYQEEYGGGTSDAFLAKYQTNGTLEYITFLGGTSSDTANDMAVDSNDNVILTGYTMSDDFPILNAIQEERVERSEMFITKFTPNSQSVSFSSYMGGSSADYGNAVKADSQNRIIVTGQTSSNDFPTTYTLNSTESRYDNVLLVVLNQDGTLLFSTLFGGTYDYVGIGVAWYSNDSYIVVGYTESTDFPIYQAYQGTHSGSNDMFIMKINLEGLIDPRQVEFTFGIIEGSIVIGTIVVVILLVLFVRRRAG